MTTQTATLTTGTEQPPPAYSEIDSDDYAAYVRLQTGDMDVLELDKEDRTMREILIERITHGALIYACGLLLGLSGASLWASSAVHIEAPTNYPEIIKPADVRLMPPPKEHNSTDH